MDQVDIASAISPPLDGVLVDSLLKEFLSLERRFLLRDWEPAALDGGQFCEIAGRALFHIDSGSLNRKKSVNSCLSYIESDSNSHDFPSRSDALQLCKATRLVYRFRSSRGAIHIDPDYSANEMDAKMVMETVRWILCELVRIFGISAPSAAANAVQAIAVHRVPAVFKEGSVPIVQNPDLDADDEILLLLREHGVVGMSTTQLKKSVPRHHSTIDKALKALSKERLITLNAQKTWILTDRGRARVDSELYDALPL